MDIKNDKSTEELILQAAERLFLEKGFAATSTTQIAREVGCNQALVHYYYRTKDNLFNVVFETKFKEFFNHIFEVKDLEKLPFQEKLKHVIESHFEMVRANPKLPMLIATELAKRPEQIRILREKLRAIPEKLLARMEAELQAEIDAGRIKPTTMMDLILNMVSLNVALFIMMPIATEIMELNENQKQFVIEHRKQQNVDLILSSLRP